jgi:hypothetical protein
MTFRITPGTQIESDIVTSTSHLVLFGRRGKALIIYIGLSRGTLGSKDMFGKWSMNENILAEPPSITDTF